MKFLKIFGIFLLFVILMGILRRCFPLDPNEPIKKEIIIPFNKLPESQQRDSINGFTNKENYKDRYFLLNENIKDGLKALVKYPETLEYFYNGEWVDGKSTYIIEEITQSPDNFLILTAYSDFRSENSYGVKVRQKFKITFEFNGNENYKIISADIEN